MCAHAVRVAIGKLPGVESVEVSLERGTTDVRLKRDNTVTLDQLRQAIKANGFNAGEAVVTAVGTLVEREGKPAFEVSGTRSVWMLTADPEARAAYEDAAQRARARAAGTVELVGLVPPPKGSPAPASMAVRRVTPLGR